LPCGRDLQALPFRLINIENLFRIDLRDANANTVLHSLSLHSNVDKVFLSSESFGIGAAGNGLKLNSETVGEIIVDYFSIDHRLIPAMGLEILAGSNFPENSSNNSNYIILNELALDVLRLGSPSDAIGRRISMADASTLEVIGVVKNFHYRSFKFPIRPMAFLNRPEEFRLLNLKLKNGATVKFKAFVNNIWEKRNGYLPDMQNFEAYFNQRQSYQEDFIAASTLSAMALFISYVGLFGVVIYTLQKRTMEIGIRKIFGGGALQITYMICKRFIKLLLVAMVLGASIGISMHTIIIDEFTYQAPFNPLLFFTSTSAITLFAVALVMCKTFRAASINPLETLRSE
jgi:putative ABC transport system permease protein